MKILLSSIFLPPFPGGAERVAWETAIRLAMRHEVHILAAGKRGIEKKQGVFIHKIPFPLFYTKLGKFAISKSLRDMRFDIMHCHMVGLWGKILPKIIKHDRLIITCHGDGVYPKKLKSKFVAEPVLKSADMITCVSKWMVDYVKEKYGIKSLYIPNGIDKRFKPLHMERNKNMILYVGQFIERKGILELLEAAKTLPEYNFYFAGRGKLSNRINLPNTKFLGFVPDEDVPKLYNEATICIFPSRFEGLPLVGLEAMSCGCPIIATRSLGFLELLQDGNTGVLIKTKSISAIVDSIRYLMENEELREKIGRNAIKESKKYQWDTITANYEFVYKMASDRPLPT